jgi:AP2-like factor (euAP2 lineage)
MMALHGRLTQRWEASLWLKGRQVYLGGFATEEEAAHMYDLAALGCKGIGTETNFPQHLYSVQLSTELAKLSQVSMIPRGISIL